MMLLGLSTMALVTLAIGLWFAFVAGIRRGRSGARTLASRFIHDTVLPTLEAIALATPSDPERAPAKLAEIRRMARGQASVLRQELDGPGAVWSGRLREQLEAVVFELARDGLRAELVADADDALSPVDRVALRDATREALRNTLNHAGTHAATIRVEESDDGIAVIIRDRGVGFDMVERPPGFGIAQSIVARIAEVGGSARIESRPGRGTRVTLRVPR